ncbi:hypothetical protein AB1N83_007196 [Pleurotus pulmonarius]
MNKLEKFSFLESELSNVSPQETTRRPLITGWLVSKPHEDLQNSSVFFQLLGLNIYSDASQLISAESTLSPASCHRRRISYIVAEQ